MSARKKLYLATNGESYDWSVEAIFDTREEAERYVELFDFADVVETWEVPDLPMDRDIHAWSCRYDMNGQNMTCHRGALSHGHIGHVDGHRGRNRGTSVYARTEDEAMAKAKAIIAEHDKEKK